MPDAPSPQWSGGLESSSRITPPMIRQAVIAILWHDLKALKDQSPSDNRIKVALRYIEGVEHENWKDRQPRRQAAMGSPNWLSRWIGKARWSARSYVRKQVPMAVKVISSDKAWARFAYPAAREAAEREMRSIYDGLVMRRPDLRPLLEALPTVPKQWLRTPLDAVPPSGQSLANASSGPGGSRQPGQTISHGPTAAHAPADGRRPRVDPTRQRPAFVGSRQQPRPDRAQQRGPQGPPLVHRPDGMLEDYTWGHGGLVGRGWSAGPPRPDFEPGPFANGQVYGYQQNGPSAGGLPYVPNPVPVPDPVPVPENRGGSHGAQHDFGMRPGGLDPGRAGPPGGEDRWHGMAAEPRLAEATPQRGQREPSGFENVGSSAGQYRQAFEPGSFGYGQVHGYQQYGPSAGGDRPVQQQDGQDIWRPSVGVGHGGSYQHSMRQGMGPGGLEARGAGPPGEEGRWHGSAAEPGPAEVSPQPLQRAPSRGEENAWHTGWVAEAGPGYHGPPQDVGSGLDQSGRDSGPGSLGHGQAYGYQQPGPSVGGDSPVQQQPAQHQPSPQQPSPQQPSPHQSGPVPAHWTPAPVPSVSAASALPWDGGATGPDRTAGAASPVSVFSGTSGTLWASAASTASAVQRSVTPMSVESVAGGAAVRGSLTPTPVANPAGRAAAAAMRTGAVQASPREERPPPAAAPAPPRGQNSGRESGPARSL